MMFRGPRDLHENIAISIFAAAMLITFVTLAQTEFPTTQNLLQATSTNHAASKYRAASEVAGNLLKRGSDARLKATLAFEESQERKVAMIAKKLKKAALKAKRQKKFQQLKEEKRKKKQETELYSKLAQERAVWKKKVEAKRKRQKLMEERSIKESLEKREAKEEAQEEFYKKQERMVLHLVKLHQAHKRKSSAFGKKKHEEEIKQHEKDLLADFTSSFSKNGHADAADVNAATAVIASLKEELVKIKDDEAHDQLLHAASDNGSGRHHALSRSSPALSRMVERVQARLDELSRARRRSAQFHAAVRSSADAPL